MSDRKIIAVFGATGAQGGGLVRAIAGHPESGFTARAITRNPASDKAQALVAMGVQVVQADADQPATLAPALDGAHGAFCVTNFWEHFSAERESAQAAAMARATKAAGVKHVVWSTLEDSRQWIPLSDPRMPTLQGKYNCPHFDAKGEVDSIFASEGGPTTYLLAAYYWDNLIHFGMGPKANEQGDLVFAMPLGGAQLPGIAAEDIGQCAFGMFREGDRTIGKRIGIAGEVLSGAQMAEKLGHALGRPVSFFDVPFDTYRGFGFPGADDLGNMFQFQQIVGAEFVESRNVARSRALHPDILDFDGWLAKYAKQIPIG